MSDFEMNELNNFIKFEIWKQTKREWKIICFYKKTGLNRFQKSIEERVKNVAEIELSCSTINSISQLMAESAELSGLVEQKSCFC